MQNTGIWNSCYHELPDRKYDLLYTRYPRSTCMYSSTMDLFIAITVEPIFQYAFFGHVGADNARHFVLGTFKILFSQIKIVN